MKTKKAKMNCPREKVMRQPMTPMSPSTKKKSGAMSRATLFVEISFEETESCLMAGNYGSSDEEDIYFVNPLFPESPKPQKENECQLTLRSGTQIPNRQTPHEVDKSKAKGKEKHTEDSPATSNPIRPTIGEYSVLAHLRKIPALISVFDALVMSKDLRDSLIYALQNPEQFKAYFVDTPGEQIVHVNSRTTGITFTDEDMLVGTSDHNRPLYVSGGKHMYRILIDAGSSINIMPLKVLKTLVMNRKFSSEKVTIHGRRVRLSFTKGVGRCGSKIQVRGIGHPHQILHNRSRYLRSSAIGATLAPRKSNCTTRMKYVKDGKQRRINADIKPFGVHEMSHYDARYFFTKEELTALKGLVAEQNPIPNEVSASSEIKAEQTVSSFHRRRAARKPSSNMAEQKPRNAKIYKQVPPNTAIRLRPADRRLHARSSLRLDCPVMRRFLTLTQTS